MIRPDRRVPQRGHSLLRECVGWWLAGAKPMGATLVNVLGPPHGVFVNVPGWAGALGRPGGECSVQFTGASSQTVQTVNNPLWSALFDGSTTAGSLACWVMVPSLPGAYSGIVTKGRSSPSIHWGFWITNLNKWGWRVITSANGPTAGTWAHLLGTRNAGSSWTLYVNGKQDATASDAATQANTAALWIGGAESVSEYLTGYVDDVKLWRRELTAGDAWAVYTESAQGHPTMLPRGRMAA